MKKHLHQVLLLIAFFVVPWVSQAQVDLTVHDGTTTNGYVPVYGYYCDDFVKSQAVYPASELAAMTGGQINGLTYYATQSSVTWSSTFQVYLMEVTSASISSFENISTATLVYQGTLGVSNYQMSITFTTPYSYAGGNLLICIQSLTDGNYSTSSWYGESVTGASVQGYDGSSVSFISPTQRDFLPKTTFSYVPGQQTCPVVSNFHYANLLSTSVDLSWTPGGTEAQWEIYISPAVEGDSLFYTTDTTYTFSNLNGNTAYRVQCRAICSATDTAYAMTTSFRTPCSEVSTFPWMLNFESETAGQPLHCWTVSGTAMASSPAYIWGVYSYGSNQMIRMNNYWVQNGSAIITSPIIQLPATGVYELMLNYSNRSSSGDLLINVIANDSTTTIATLPSSGSYDQNDPGTFTEFSTVLAAYAGQNIQLQFYNNANYESGAIFIDDISIQEAPSCLRPENLHAETVASDQITLAWSEMGTATSWVVEYDDAVFTPGASQGEVVLANDTTVTLTNLLANTVYHIYLHADCGAGDTSTNRYLQVRTACGEQVLPYVEDFEGAPANDMPFCWQRVESYTAYSGEYPYVEEDTYGNGYAHSGTKSLYIYRYYPPLSVASPRIPVPANQIEVLFWGKTEYGSAPLQIGYTDNPDSISHFQLVETVTLSSTYAEYTVSFDTVATTDTVYVVFRYNGNSTYYGIYIDDITFRAISACSKPSDLRMTATDATSVTLTWSDTNENNSAYDVVYGVRGINPDTVETFIIEGISDTTTVVNNLADSVDYDFYVRTNCGSEYSYWCGPLSARPNLYVMPLSGTDTITACGGLIADDGGTVGNFSNTANGYMVVYPSDPDSTVRLTGVLNSYHDYGEYYYGTLTIYDGVGTNGRVLGSYSGENVLIDDTASMGPLTIHFSGDNGWSSSATNEGFLLTVSCVEGVNCVSPYSLTMGSLAGTSANASWSYDGTDDPTFVAIVTDIATGTTLTFTTDTTTITLTGLDQLTDYQLRVATYCGVGDTSQFITASFRTKCISGGEETIAQGSATNNHIPTYFFYKYGLSQQVYASTILPAQLDTIYGIGFNMTSSTTTGYDRNVDIFMDTTSQTTITAYIPQDSAHRFFSGMVHFEAGWTTINFSTPFIYDGHSNLLLTMTDNTGSYVDAPYFACENTTGTSAISYYTDNFAYDPTSATQTTSCFSESAHNTLLLLTPCGNATCAAPNVTLANTTANSIAITWVAGSGETAWSVEYREDGTANWTTAMASTSQTAATINGLNANTLYDVRVGSLCGDTTAYALLNARTSCAAITQFPFFENFEEFIAPYNAPSFEPCWFRGPGMTSYGSTYYYPEIYNYEAHSGSKSLELVHNSYPSDYYSYLILPEMGVDIDTLMVDFYMNASSYSTESSIIVGAMTDPTNLATFVAIDTIDYPGAGDVWEYVELELRSYTGTGRYIALTLTSGSDYVYIDDIEVSIASNCVRPFNTTVDSANFSQAFLSFSDTANAGSYTIVYGTVNNVTAATDTVTVNDTVAVLNNLNSSTAYYAWVRANCNPEVSRWVAFPVINTSCNVIVISDSTSLYESFEGDYPLPCWRFLYADPNPATGNLMSHSTDQAIAGQQSFRFSSYSYSSGDYTQYLISPELSATEAVAFAFSYRNHSSYSDETFAVGYSTTGNDPEDFTWGNDNTATGCVWNRFETYLPDSTKYVAIRYTADCRYYLYIDSLSVSKAPTCIKPDNFSIVTPGATTITIGWNSLTAAPAFEVEYSLTGTPATVVTNTNSVTLTGLTPLTVYSLRVRALCGGNDTSDWSNDYVFTTTICDNADVTSTGAASGFTTLAAPLNNYYNYTLSETIIDSAELNGPKAISAISYQYAAAQASTAKTNVDIYLQPTDKTEFASTADMVALDTVTAVKVYSGALVFTEGWNIITLDTVYNYDGNGNILVIVDDNSGSYGSSWMVFATADCTAPKTISYYDDSNNPDVNNPSTYTGYNAYTYNWRPVMELIACGSLCPAPTIISVTPTYESVSITWAGTGESYQVAYRTLDGTYGTPVNVSGTGYTITGLQPATDYMFRVRTDCTADSNDYSNWVEGTFTTDSLPCFAPTDFANTAVTNSTATFAWTPGSTETAWEINVFNTTFDQTFEVTANPATVNGLTSGVTYNAAIRALCGSSHSFEGPWSDTIQFTTTICDPVSNVSATADGTTITLTWTPGANNCGNFEVEYGEHGFGQGEGTTVAVSGNSKTFTDLEELTQYDFYVRAVCAEGWFSAWSEVATATTGESQGIHDVNGNFSCTIFPNPATDETTISVSGVNGQVTVAVVDMNGRIVSAEMLSCAADCEKKVNVSGLAQGTYFVRITGDNVNSVKKLIVR